MANEELKQEVELRKKSNAQLEKVQKLIDDIGEKQKTLNKTDVEYIKLQAKKSALQKTLNKLAREETGTVKRTLDIGDKLLQNIIAAGKFKEIEHRTTGKLAKEWEGIYKTSELLNTVSKDYEATIDGSKNVGIEHQGILERINQISSDLGDQILQNVENEKLIGQEGFGASKIKNLEDQLKLIENLLANKQFISKIDKIDLEIMRGQVKAINDRITLEEEIAEGLETQNFKVNLIYL